MGIEVIAIGQRHAPRAVIERVADRTAPSRVRDVDPELQALFPQMAVKIEVAHARLDERISVFLAHLEDPVHPLQVEDDTAGIRRRGTAVGKVASGGDRVKRDGEAVRDREDLLNLLDAVRGHGRRDDSLIRLTPKRGIGVLVRCDVLLSREDPLRAHGARELLQSLGEIPFAHTRRCSHASLTPCFFGPLFESSLSPEGSLC